MFNSKSRNKFMEFIKRFYNDKNLKLSEPFREKLLEVAVGLEKKSRISYLAYVLYPYVSKEVMNNPNNLDLLDFKKYLERQRWKYYFGMVSIIPISNLFKK